MIIYSPMGAARTVTGSMHYLDIDGFRILLDSGEFQGTYSFEEEFNRKLLFQPDEIDAIILSHAHIDHIGRLPYLVEHGFRGKIYATGATIDLADLILRDAAEIEFFKQRENPEYNPLIKEKYIQKTLSLIKPIKYGQRTSIEDNISVRLLDAGHILGSAQIELSIERKGQVNKILFTGDLGRKGLPIIRDPERIREGTDILITEGTYGDSIHSTIEDAVFELYTYIEMIYRHQSKLLIPAFAVGRTQTLIYYLNEMIEKRRIPRIPVYIDSPLSVNVTDLFRIHRECYDDETWELLNSGDNPLDFRDLHYITDEEESYEITRKRGAAIIIASSGMCTGGRILRHLSYALNDPASIVLFTSYQAKGTLGRKLIDGAKKVIISGKKIKVRAKIRQIKGFSAHADQPELIEHIWRMKNKPKLTALVHGEPKALRELEKKVKREKLTKKTIVPKFGEKTTLDKFFEK